MNPSEEDLQRMVNALAERAGFLSGLPGKTISAQTAMEIAAAAPALVHAIWPVVRSIVLEEAAKAVEAAGGIGTKYRYNEMGNPVPMAWKESDPPGRAYVDDRDLCFLGGADVVRALK